MLTIFDRQTGIPSDLETLSEDEIGNLHMHSDRHMLEEERLADEATTARFAEKIRQIYDGVQKIEPVILEEAQMQIVAGERQNELVEDTGVKADN